MNMKPDMLRALIVWVSEAIIITGLCLLIYTAVQQNYREGLNDPQIQMAEDAAAKLASGAQISSVVPTQTVDLQASLSPWIAVYSSAGAPILSSGQLNGAPPQPPKGLFDDSTWLFTKVYETPQGKETRITWQPQGDVRQAIVLIHL